MSRAFVSESDREDEIELPPAKSPLPAGSRNYITPWGLDALREEIQHLEGTEKPRLSAALNAARDSAAAGAASDLSEAKRQSALVERRLAYLKDLARRAEVVIPERRDPPVAGFGTRIRVRDKERLVEEAYQVVGVYEADPGQGLVSWVSPVARALKGSSAGDIVEVPLPDGPRVLKVLEISYADDVPPAARHG